MSAKHIRIKELGPKAPTDRFSSLSAFAFTSTGIDRRQSLTSPAPVLDLKPLEVGLGHVRLDVHLHSQRERKDNSDFKLELHAAPLDVSPLEHRSLKGLGFPTS